MARFAGGTAVLAALLLATGCDRTPRNDYSEEMDAASVSRLPSDLPVALSLRFEEVKGTGFSRESWDLEILQVESDIRVRGGVRTAGSYVPVFRTMDRGEFADLWQWVHAFPLDGLRVREDTTAAPADWRKTLRYDAVLDESHRELSDNQWTRPLADPPWVSAIEDRLHLMVLELAGQELDEAGPPRPAVPDTAGVLRKTLEAIGEAPPTDGTP